MAKITKDTHALITDTDNGLLFQDNNVLVQDTSSKELMYVPFNEAKLIFGHELNINNDNNNYESEEEASQEEIKDKIWNSNNVLYLIHKVEESQTKFNNTLKKNVWIEIAQKCTIKFGKPVIYQNCESKWKCLKRTYKSILLHNKTSGKQRKHWEFFNVIHQFMNNKPEINPVATCSNVEGLRTKETEAEFRSSSTCNETSVDTEESPEGGRFESRFMQKRKARESWVQQRHREKMSRQDRFNDLFEKLLDKL